ncbi:hypothetical protein PN36_28415 [Candidatus Thiomargarita nelsonii]|uniref:Cytochrome c domain-containing protein n=1 Tax=Candidatus Thiomargarita nelsonii TaxID=1003181 RepID=A0A4E0QLN9_9GAMM|nr:hypothetical protein PN36_28415 [Candidatus Thiomargarita nelsonii]
MNQSGAMQSETNRTGEIYTGFMTGDDDGDGIPSASGGKSHGRYGIAPLIASKVVINVGGSKNRGFRNIQGERHNPNSYNRVRMKYKRQSKQQQRAIIVSLKEPQVPGLVERQPMVREDGTTIPLQPTKPITVGLGTVLNLSGRQIFEANCSKCHGQHGEGIDGLPLERAMNWPHAAMAAFATNGIFNGFMPPWGVGNGDEAGGTLTQAEINKIVDYVQSETFKRNYEKAQNGEVVPGALPKDVWFYLSRENAKAKGKKISNGQDAQRYFAKHASPAKIKAKFWENLRRLKPDAELSLDDREALLRYYSRNN